MKRLRRYALTPFDAQHSTDHMMVATFHPKTGWSAPEIKPYGPLTLDPACSCFQYCTSLFEGMKVTLLVCIYISFSLTICDHTLCLLQAYPGPDGKPRLFRPKKNMERMTRSAARVALPVSIHFA